MSESRTRLLGLIAFVGLVTAGCASDAELDTLKPQSDTAREIDDLLDPVLLIAGVVLVLVCAAVVWLSVKNRVDTYEGDDDMPAHIKASLLGSSLTLPVHNGRLRLGTWQGIYLCEHRDYGGSRRLVLTLQGQTRQA